MCDAAWSGNDNCSTLAFLPAKMSNGYGHPKQAHRPASSVSSWGAGVVQDQLTKNWIMGVSDYALNCGQSAFPPNQQCGIAVSTTGPDGPYIKNRTMIDPYCEGSSIARDPLSGRWLYLHGGNGVAGYALTHRQKIGPENHCWNCRGSDGVTPTSVQTQFMHQNLSNGRRLAIINTVGESTCSARKTASSSCGRASPSLMSRSNCMASFPHLFSR